MQGTNSINRVLPILLALSGLLLVLASMQSYETLKEIGSRLVVDGDFNSLKENNAQVFKILLGSGGLFLILFAAIINFGYFHKLIAGLKPFYSDTIQFFSGLTPSRSAWKYLACLGFIIWVAAVLRFQYLNNPMSHDESYTFIVFASTSFFNMISNYHLPNNHVFHTLLVSLSTDLLGIQPWAVRLPAFLAGLILIPASYALARLIYDRYTALASALLVAIFYGPISYAANARGYSLVALFTLLILWLGIYVSREKNLFAWSLLILFATLGFYTVPVMLYPFGIVYVWLLVENLLRKGRPAEVASPGGARQYRSKLEFMKYWLAGGFCTALIVLILYTPIFIFSGVGKVFANQWVSPTTWDSFIRSTPVHLSNTWNEWFYGEASWVPTLLAIGFLLSIFLHARISKLRFPLQIAALGWVLTLLLIQRTHTGPKIFAFLQPPFLIWSSAGFMGLLKGRYIKFLPKAPWSVLAVGLLLLVGFFKGGQAVRDIPLHWSEKGAIENTVLFIREHLSQNDLVIVDSPCDSPTWYYSRLYNLPGDLFNKDIPFNRLWVIVCPNNEKSIASVLQERGPDPAMIDDEASLLWSTGTLDLYLVSHR
jgi:hypothetical protein